MAQTVLPVAPQLQALDRCNKMVVVRPSEAAAAAREVLGASGTTPDQRLAATTCMAVAQLLAGDGEEGAAALDQALLLLDSSGVTPEGRLDGQMRLASMLARLGRLDEALAMQEEVLAAARERDIVPMQVESLRFMAAIRAGEFDDPEGALPYFRQAYDLHRVLVGASGAIHPPLSYDLGYTLMQLGQYEEADAMFVEASAGAAPIPELAGMDDRIASHRAEILRLRGDPGTAEPRLVAALARQRAGGDRVGEAATLQRLARARLDLGRAQEALMPAHESLAVAERGHFSAEVRDALHALADIHAVLGQQEAAAGYAARAREVGRGLDRAAAARRLAAMQAVAANDLAPKTVAGRIGDERGVMLRNIAIVVLVVLVLLALVLLVLAHRRQHRLESISVTDALTGLPDRRGATQRLEARVADGAARAALLLVDIDYFEELNERFGHDAGDRALVAVARCVRESCDTGDLVARWGGGTLLVLREDTTQEAMFALAAHLRSRVGDLQFDGGAGAPAPLSASIGAVPLPLFPRGNGGWQGAMRAADRALFVAKRAGRNAWAGLWGVAPAIDPVRALADMRMALAEGWLVVGGNRPMDWSEARPLPAAGMDAGVAPSGAPVPRD